MTTERGRFEAWDRAWRNKSWVALPSDPRKDPPEHWGISGQDSRWAAWQAALAQPAAQAVAGCTCETCMPQGDPINGGMMRFIVCAICGNKRCPHATDHRNACTNSNEPGQKGSSWENFPAAPQPAAQREPQAEPPKPGLYWCEAHGTGRFPCPKCVAPQPAPAPSAVVDALRELVACKELKDELDRFGESHNAIDANLARYQWLTSEYDRRKAAAKDALQRMIQP